MAPRPLRDLRNTHPQSDIYIIGAGPSAGFVDLEFFENKIVIGVNETYRRFRVDYMVRKESARSYAAYMTGIPLVISRHSCGATVNKLNRLEGPYDYYVFDHANNRNEHEPDWSVIGTVDKLVVSYSTITSAIHLAAYMGASNIILVGHDCGTLDGNTRYDGYPSALLGEPFYRSWLSQIENQTLMLRTKLAEVYRCRVYSLNPFINFGLEGHAYER